MKTDEKILHWSTGFSDGAVNVPPKSAADLKILGPVGAVLKCALDAGLITQAEHDTLLKDLLTPVKVPIPAATSSSVASAPIAPNIPPYFYSNFASVVSKEDPSCRTPEELIENVPLGAIIGFVEVDVPVPGSKDPRRYLLHLMLSLGQGWAIGLANEAIGVAASDWQVVDLARCLNWIPVPSQKNLDSFNASNAPGTPRPARIHYRAPKTVQAAAMTWGLPDDKRSTELKAILIQAAAAQINRIYIESSTKRPGFIRPWIQFRIPLNTYHEFFNSPNGIRGIYYADADQGDAYCLEILEGISKSVNFQTVELRDYADYSSTPSTIAPQMRNLLGSAIKAGKIWSAIKRVDANMYVMQVDPWNPGQHQCLPNRRWKCDESSDAARIAASDLLLARFFAEPFVSSNISNVDQETAVADGVAVASLPPDRTARAQITTKARSDLVRHGSKFFTEHMPADAYANVDVKGAWINQAGKIGAFEPPEKFARNYQIKWFGFT